MIQNYHRQIRVVLGLNYNTGSVSSLQKPRFSSSSQIILTFFFFQTKSRHFQFELSIWQIRAKTPIFYHEYSLFFNYKDRGTPASTWAKIFLSHLQCRPRTKIVGISEKLISECSHIVRDGFRTRTLVGYRTWVALLVAMGSGLE